MSPLPDIKGPDRKKPLCYDPERRKFIYFDELIAKTEKIIPLERLSHEQLKKLIVERYRAGPDFTMQVLSGAKYTRNDLIKEIRKQTDIGKMTMEAEKSYLSELLEQIKESL